MVFSKTKINKDIIKPLTINNADIEFVDKIKYLGTNIESSPSLSFSHEDDLCSFYRAANSVLNQIQVPDETILMHLLYSHCVPCFTYASSIKDYTGRQMTDCTTALNNAIRKIFTFHKWESVRSLRESFGYPALCETFAKANRKFVISLPNHNNRTISQLHAIVSVET